MTIEEKAKAYDEALKKLHEIITMDNHPVLPKEIGEFLFPELTESADERMRKAALKGIEFLELELGWDAIGDTDILDVKEYLEKQKEQKPAKWNDADDKIHRNLMSLLSCMRGDRIAEETYKKYYPWLRDLPKRFNLQQEQPEVDLEKERLQFEATVNMERIDKSLAEAARHWADDADNMMGGDYIACVIAEKAFKAGAEWMAEQGETFNGYISIKGKRSLIAIKGKSDICKFGDEVIVQIRKK